MSHSCHSDEEIASAYLAYYRTKQDVYYWAWEYLMNLVDSDAERAWIIILQLISLTTDEAEMAYIAAGSLEDILTYRIDQFIDRAEDQARKDPQFRIALSHVRGLNNLKSDFFERLKIFLPQV